MAPERKRKAVQINWLITWVSCMVFVTLATIRPSAEKAADPNVTNRRMAPRFPHVCM